MAEEDHFEDMRGLAKESTFAFGTYKETFLGEDPCRVRWKVAVPSSVLPLQLGDS